VPFEAEIVAFEVEIEAFEVEVENFDCLASCRLQSRLKDAVGTKDTDETVLADIVRGDLHESMEKASALAVSLSIDKVEIVVATGDIRPIVLERSVLAHQEAIRLDPFEVL
jgi:hypothetical protein